jgi:IS5 family transposase
MALVTRLLRQTPKGPNKIYALHEPEVDCIFKGKARVRYEFGTKVSIATTLAGGFGRHELVRLATPIDWSWSSGSGPASFPPLRGGRPSIRAWWRG